MDRSKIKILVVDDERGLCVGVQEALKREGYAVDAADDARTALKLMGERLYNLVLTDMKMPHMSGLDVQTAMIAKGMSMPIIFLSAQSDVPSTVRAMRGGAIDFLEKPVDEDQLLAALERARVQCIAMRQQQRLQRDTEQRLARLTKREREVCDLVAAGLLNKQIAVELGMSEKTVKVHRGRVTRKLDVDSVAALVRLLSTRETRS